MNQHSSKKILVLLGSPRRNGNSAILAEKIAEGAASSGAASETIFLQDLKIAPCTSCYACQKKKTKGCSIADDMQILYPKLVEADAWVIASPVYWFNMSAQTKLWMDRCFALPAYGKDPFSGKRIAVAMSYGDADPLVSGCVNAIRTFQDAYAYVGAKFVGFVYGSAMGAGEIASQESLLQQAEALGRKLFEDAVAK
jgi:multimeric flavodoxin WrbA